MVLRLPDSWSNWNSEMLVFGERGKLEYPEKNPLGAKERTNNRLNPHMASTPGFEPGPHWWGRALSPLRNPLLPKGLLADNWSHLYISAKFLFCFYGYSQGKCYQPSWVFSPEETKTITYSTGVRILSKTITVIEFNLELSRFVVKSVNFLLLID